MEPGGASPSLFVTTSWDDGHPSDRRLSDLLERHAARGTFYVPTRNAEGRPVMSGPDLIRLGRYNEIGGHTKDHIPLTGLPAGSAYEQIRANKLFLEDSLSRSVPGFAYVRGANNLKTRKLVRRAGYRYARGIKSLTSHRPSQPFAMPVTIQFFPHQTKTYVKNFISGGPTYHRTRLLCATISDLPLAARCFALARACLRSGRHFHLWGHSWELDEYDLWSELDNFFTRLRELQPIYVSNADMVSVNAPLKHSE